MCFVNVVQALMGIKTSLVDPHGILDNWDGDAVDPCSWNMVTCSPQNLVISLWVSLSLSSLFYIWSWNTKLMIKCLICKNCTAKMLYLFDESGVVFCSGIPSQNLSGTLSPSIGNLTNLQTV